MAVTTLTAVKSVLQITATSQDSIISTLIPVVEEHLISICNQFFIEGGIAVTGVDLTFTASSGTVTASSFDFEEEGFAADDEIVIEDSFRNDGRHTVSSVSAESIVVTSATTLVSEVSGASVAVALMSWPPGIDLIAAQMISFDMNHRTAKKGLPAAQKSALQPGPESDRYGYPTEIISALQQYMVVRYE